MASRLENAARNAISDGSIMSGREPIKTEEIIAKYPEGVCITAIAKNTYNGSTYPVFTFAEEPSKYFSGGTLLSQMVDKMLDNEYDGNMSELNSDLQREYLKIKLEKKKTKRGYNLTRPIIVGTVRATKYVDENNKVIDKETGEVLEDNVPF